MASDEKRGALKYMNTHMKHNEDRRRAFVVLFGISGRKSRSLDIANANAPLFVLVPTFE